MPDFRVLVWAAIAKTHWRPREEYKTYKEDLDEFMVMPFWWEVTPAGLKVVFSTLDQMGYYGRNPEPVTVPWSELKPLLSKTAVVP